MSREGRRQFKIYGPAHFRATWEKFLEIAHRDGQTASELIRIWVEGYVKRKDPGNPQRPITAYVEGHEDQEKLQTSIFLKDLHNLARHHGETLPYRLIIKYLKDLGVKPLRRKVMANALAHELKERGITIPY